MNTFKRIKVSEAREVLQAGNALLVDIRDITDYEDSHDDIAFHLTNNNISPFIENTDKQSPLVVMCYHGNSSQQVAQYLAEQGFVTVYSMDGGYEEWKSKG